MGQNNTLKIVSVFAFIALASVSCWATQESLHLLQPNWPQFLCWIVTIAFFIIASWGTKLIVDSLNQNVYVEGRGKKLIGGILILLFFWLVFSMPTNTHTFFYRNSIESVTRSDISTTKGYLAQLRDNTLTEDQINARQTEFKNKVWSRIENLSGQIEYLKKRNAELEKMRSGRSAFGWKSLAISSLTIFMAIVLIFIYCLASGIISFSL